MSTSGSWACLDQILHAQAAIKKTPRAELTKAEKKRLRQERDPNFKGQVTTENAAGPAASAPEQPGRPAQEPAKRKARGVGFKDSEDRSKRLKGDQPADNK